MTSKALRLRVGAELRRIRQGLNVHAESVAEALGWSPSKMSRIETGLINISLVDLSVLLDYYNQPEEVRAELLTLVMDGSGVDGAWLVRAGGASRRMSEVAAVESRVSRIRQYAHVAVPGQLQSPSYIDAMVALGTGDPAQMAEKRRARQELLNRNGAPEYHAILDARTFMRWPPSDRPLVSEQIAFLQQRNRLPNVTVRVVPLDTEVHMVPLNHFILYDFIEDTPPVAFVETQAVDLYLSAERDVARYDAVFSQLEIYALDAAESMTYIEWLLSIIETAPPFQARRS